MATIFDKGDEEYFYWMNSNPDGFILNTGKGSNTSVFFLHKSGCMHITESDGFDSGAYTMRGFVKIGSNAVSELVEYCLAEKSNFNGGFKYCKSCKPEHQEIEIVYPDEISEKLPIYHEGIKRQIVINSYERNVKARKKCIDHLGYECQCCGLNFENRYGEIGRAFIHVHHLKPISEIGRDYEINPIEDLIPLCPNCHAMIHKSSPPFTVNQLKEIMERTGNSSK